MTVTYSWNSLRRGFGDSGDAGCFLILKPETGTEDARSAAVAAIETANATNERLTVGGPPMNSPKGVVVPIWSTEWSPQSRRPWVDAFCANLEQQGVSGRLTAASNRWHPDYREERKQVPTAFIAYQLNDPGLDWTSNPLAGWNVDPDVADQIGRLARDWPRDLSTSATWAQTWQSVQVESDPHPYLVAASQKMSRGSTTWMRWAAESGAYSRVTIGMAGLLVCQLVDPGASLDDYVAAYGEIILASPAHVGHAMIRMAPERSHWDSLERDPAPPGSPGIMHIGPDQTTLRLDFVPDAYGISLLTDRHLARAHDLSGWDVEPVGHGRNWVKAEDLSRWFDPQGVAQETLRRARRDFGPIIAATPLPASW